MRVIGSISVGLAFALMHAWAAEPVLLGARHEGAIEAFRLDNLEPVARIRVKGMVEGVDSSADGERLYVRAPHPQAPDVCCALFLLDSASMRMIPILWPALGTAVGGGRVFTQRGDNGIEVFDTRSGARLPPLPGPGVYQLDPSPDGRWLVGARQFPNAALDIFDLQRGAMVHSLLVAGAPVAHGAWIGSKFYLLAVDPAGGARLWAVDSQTDKLGFPQRVSFEAGPNCEPGDYDVAAAGEKLALYQKYGMKSGARGCSVKGGYVLVDPASGTASARIAPDLHLGALVPAPDGKSLYGVDLAGQQPALVKLDAASGEIRAKRPLAADAWHFSIGDIPDRWVGKLELKTTM